jgi:hypothetical protein
MNKRHLFLQFFIVILILVTMALPVNAAGGVTVTLTPNQSELTVGDPVELSLEVTHPTGYQVIIPQLEQNWGPFEVRGQSQATTVANNDGTETTRQTITVTLFDLGAVETPALPLTISSDTGQVMEETVPPISLTVNSVLSEGDTTLKDIRPQVGMKVPSAWPAVLAGLLVVAGATAAGWWLYRRWQGKKSLARVLDNRSPYQVAYDELDRIDGLALPEKGRFKEHYTLVTDALRLYIEQQFRVHAFDRTTTELKQSLGRSTMSPEYTRRFIDFFFESDLVKFAKLLPDLDEARHLTDSARNLVNLTQPIPEAEQPEVSQPAVGVGHPQKPVEVVQ